MQLTHASDQFLQGYFSTHDRSRKTPAAYLSNLAQFKSFASGERELLGLDGALIEQWAAHLREEGYSPASIRRKMVLLKVFCSYWVRKGVLSESPFWRIKLSFGRVEQLPRSLTGREMRKLLAQARRNYSEFEMELNDNGNTVTQLAQVTPRAYRALRNLALVDLLFATGTRVGEVAMLDIRDFYVRETCFRVQGKGGRDRLAFVVDDGTLQIQRAHLEARKQIATENKALFLNASGERLSTQGIANVIARLRQDAGIERHITPHMLRHGGDAAPQERRRHPSSSGIFRPYFNCHYTTIHTRCEGTPDRGVAQAPPVVRSVGRAREAGEATSSAWPRTACADSILSVMVKDQIVFRAGRGLVIIEAVCGLPFRLNEYDHSQ